MASYRSTAPCRTHRAPSSIARIAGAALIAGALATGSLVSLAPAAPAAADLPPIADPPTFSVTDTAPGWASQNGGTDGGANADVDSTYVVGNRTELMEALDNNGAPTVDKVIYVVGTIHGNEAADGTLLGEQEYAPGYNIELYLSCFGPDGWSDSLHEYCGEQRRLRTTGSNALKRQIEISIPSNTTLVGLGDDAGFDQANIMLHLANDVVIRNLTFEAPTDYFTSWDPQDGAEGSWNARFDAMSSVTSTNIWVDHVTFTDGRYLDGDAPLGPNGKPINFHDGLFDMKDGTDYVTLSNSHLTDHDKTMLLGSGDGNADTDAGTLRITIVGNWFDGTGQRSPRVRFGQVHVVNNYYSANVNDPDSPVVGQAQGGPDYFLGVGFQSQILSQLNSFDYNGPGADSGITVHVFNGTQFHDEGSWFRNQPADINAVAAASYQDAVAAAAATGEPLPEWATAGFSTASSWAPPYTLDLMTSAAQVKFHGRFLTGAGVLEVAAP